MTSVFIFTLSNKGSVNVNIKKGWDLLTTDQLDNLENISQNQDEMKHF